MKIRLLADFRGSITQERYYVAGEYEAGGVMPLAHAKALVADGRAVWLEVAKPKPAQPTEAKRKPVKRRRKASK